MKSGEKLEKVRGKVGKGGENCGKWGKVTKSWEKLGKVGKSGEKWGRWENVFFFKFWTKWPPAAILDVRK